MRGRDEHFEDNIFQANIALFFQIKTQAYTFQAYSKLFVCMNRIKYNNVLKVKVVND